jgi:hypothetical protein
MSSERKIDYENNLPLLNLMTCVQLQHSQFTIESPD